MATCTGTIAGISPPPPGRRRAPLVLLLRDAGGYGTATLFGRGWLTRVLQRGQRVILHGKGARFKDKITLQVQDWEVVDSSDDEPIHAGALVPVYSSTEGLPQRALRSLQWRLVEAHAADVAETLPEPLRRRRNLVGLPSRCGARTSRTARTSGERPSAGWPSRTSCCSSSASPSCARARPGPAASR